MFNVNVKVEVMFGLRRNGLIDKKHPISKNPIGLDLHLQAELLQLRFQAHLFNLDLVSFP
jgi:hypothetical protein